MLVVGAAHSGEISGTGSSWAGGVQFFDPLVWDGEKNEIKYARTKRGIEFEHQGKVRVYAALCNFQRVEPATAVLDKMLKECVRVVGAIEAEGKGIGVP